MPEVVSSPQPLDLTVRGRRLGVDVGQVRVGVALTDPDAILATPLTTLERDLKKHFDVKIAAKLVREHGVVEVVVGLPLAMSGEHTDSTRAALDWAQRLADRLERTGEPTPVHMVDERWTSVESHRMLHQAGLSRRDHKSKVDQQAAVTILEAALAAARRADKGRDPSVTRGADQNTDMTMDDSASSAKPEGDLT
ncbi:Holliday junction resolvase RuvX [Kocuria sp.]|uniref:Holliday junction resolvase RuvX n=1 Tax=Kocuria sp. TaxID=1871328 RepID=UPI0026E03A18|nr:Holliday junction resolvase RuvX [Kocuria sp.]MDO5617655.1 Holliday junction resolvase RuvX [Kocuria sp.]